jgi:hypothetical protein
MERLPRAGVRGGARFGDVSFLSSAGGVSLCALGLKDAGLGSLGYRCDSARVESRWASWPALANPLPRSIKTMGVRSFDR